jgi:ABC-type antimicrobial peptide transport system permease subunit
MAIIVLFGVGIGTASGLWFSTALLPLLEVAEEGGRVVPPMILDTNWSIMVMAYAVLGGATAVTFGAVAWLIARLDIQQVLRAGRA